MFRRKTPQVQSHADLIDLLLDSDEPTRKLLLFQALQAGALMKSEAEEVMAMVARLERAAGPGRRRRPSFGGAGGGRGRLATGRGLAGGIGPHIGRGARSLRRFRSREARLEPSGDMRVMARSRILGG